MSTIRLFSAVLALIVVAAPFARADTAPAFVDRFVEIDEDRWIVADGWSNGEWTANDWRRSQTKRTSTGLAITLSRSRGGEKRYSSGEIQSEQLYQYGYFETRMRVPRGSGLVTGFFTYVRSGEQSTWQEIDVEILGRDTRTLRLSYFYEGEPRSTNLPLGFDAAAGFHTYGFEWTAERLRWYVDGRLMHEETGENGPIPQTPQRLYMHLWNSTTLTDWLGPIRPWEGPWTLRTSCIAYAPTYEGRSLCAPAD